MALVAGGGINKPLPAAILSQLLPPVRGRGLRIAVRCSSDDDERVPLIPTGTPVSSTSTSASSDPAPITSFPGAEGTPASSTSASSSDPSPTTSLPGATGAKQWRLFRRVGDVFDAWTKQGHEEPYPDIDIEMAFPAAPFPNPASSKVKANSAPPRWANRRVGDGQAMRFQASATSSVASVSGQSAAESMVGAGTSSGSVMGAGSAFGSVVGAGSASGQGATIDWMKRFKGLLMAYVFFALPIILFFFPRYDKNQSHSVLQNLMDSSKVDFEKVFILVLFVIHVTAGVFGVLLAHIAQGPMVTKAVGVFTLWVITSIAGFMDYILLKTMPENLTTTLMFSLHFIITVIIIFFLWFKYVWPSCCCQRGARQD